MPGACHSSRSRPAVKARPAPVRISTRIAGSASSASIAAANSRRIWIDSTLSFFGRFSTTVA